MQQECVRIDDIELCVSYKPQVRRMTLRVRPSGELRLSVPVGTPLREIESLVHQKRSWIDRTRQQLSASPMARVARATNEEKAAWRQVVESFVPLLVAKWEPVMGVKAGKLAYRCMSSRWGSCQPTTGRICINIALALYPPECLKYVVVHELAHLIVPGHGPRFRAILDQHLPNWKESAKLLK